MGTLPPHTTGHAQNLALKSDNEHKHTACTTATPPHNVRSSPLRLTHLATSTDRVPREATEAPTGAVNSDLPMVGCTLRTAARAAACTLAFMVKACPGKWHMGP
jgi:hypothetical protein